MNGSDTQPESATWTSGPADARSLNTAESSGTKVEIAALCVGNALGTCVSFAVPIWVAAFIRDGFLPVTKVGWLASAQLVLLAGAGIGTSLRGGAFNQRRIGVTLAGVIAFATLLAAIHAYAAVVTGLFLFALASGVLHSLMVRAGALRPNAPRVLALMTAAAMALGGLTTLLSRHAMQHVGVSGLFLMIAAVSVAAGIAMFFGFSVRRVAACPPTCGGAQVKGILSLGLAPVLACIAGALVNMAGMTSAGPYSLVIGTSLGFTSAAATGALAFSEPFSLAGPLLAHQLGERAGLMRPILIGTAVLAASQFLLVNALSPQVLSVSLIIIGVTFAFCIPYAMALVGRLDPSGRLVGALPGLMTIGSSIGPSLGGSVIAGGSFRALAPVAASLYLIALVLFWWAGHWTTKEGNR